jgi:hypothetical protein
MSSCEAEYIAGTSTSCQVVWLSWLLSKIIDKEVQQPVLKIDNKSAISLIRNLVLNEKSRHIHTRYHLMREYEANGQICVQFIRTEQQLGDILTKSLNQV